MNGDAHGDSLGGFGFEDLLYTHMGEDLYIYVL